MHASPLLAASPSRPGAQRRPAAATSVAAMGSSADMLHWQRGQGAGRRSRSRPATSGSVEQDLKYPTLLRASQDRRQFGVGNRKYAKPKVRSVRDDWVVQ